MENIAHSDNIIEKRTVWDAKIGVEVGEHIVEGGFTKEEVAKEARCYVHD